MDRPTTTFLSGVVVRGEEGVVARFLFRNYKTVGTPLECLDVSFIKLLISGDQVGEELYRSERYGGSETLAAIHDSAVNRV